MSTVCADTHRATPGFRFASRPHNTYRASTGRHHGRHSPAGPTGPGAVSATGPRSRACRRRRRPRCAAAPSVPSKRRHRGSARWRSLPHRYRSVLCRVQVSSLLGLVELGPDRERWTVPPHTAEDVRRPSLLSEPACGRDIGPSRGEFEPSLAFIRDGLVALDSDRSRVPWVVPGLTRGSRESPSTASRNVRHGGPSAGVCGGRVGFEPARATRHLSHPPQWPAGAAAVRRSRRRSGSDPPPRTRKPRRPPERHVFADRSSSGDVLHHERLRVRLFERSQVVSPQRSTFEPDTRHIKWGEALAGRTPDDDIGGGDPARIRSVPRICGRRGSAERLGCVAVPFHREDGSNPVSPNPQVIPPHPANRSMSWGVIRVRKVDGVSAERTRVRSGALRSAKTAARRRPGRARLQSPRSGSRSTLWQPRSR